MARGVVWIFLFDGDTIVFLCSGIPIEHNPSCTKVLTSTNLAAAMRDKTKSSSAMKIQVRDAFSNVAPGCLEECELDHGTVRAAVVKVTVFLDVCEVHLHHGVEIPPLIVVIAIHYNDSGGATAVKEIPSKVSTPSETVLCNAGDGELLFDGDGNFVGMAIFSDGRHVYVQGSVIFENLVEFARRIRVRVRQQERYRRSMSEKGKRRCRHDVYDDPVKRKRTFL
uniref:Uncharacterized protein n=1 Tax=Triticum urartu TaxID=4572 RepID=A0A8R7TDF3_TRIUA